MTLFILNDTVTSCKMSENSYEWYWRKTLDKQIKEQKVKGYFLGYLLRRFSKNDNNF